MKNIKKLSFLIIALFMSIMLVSCGNKNSDKDNNNSNNISSTTYSVTFKVDDTIFKSSEISLNEKIIEPETPEKPDYIFMGWYNGDTKWDFQKNVVTDNLILTAKFLGDFDEDGYKVIFTKEQLKE